MKTIKESEKWRTYKDEKPEKGRLVLVYRDIEIKQIYATIWSDEDELYAEWNDITHWRYIDYPTADT